MKYKCIKKFKGKSLGEGNKEVTFPKGSELTRQGDFLYYGDVPVCVWRSQVAKDFFVWNGDGQGDLREEYLNVIVHGPREKSWIEVREYEDPETHEVKKENIVRKGRFSPEEAEYLEKTYPQFFNPDGIFSDYFYVGSHVSDLKDMSSYLNREGD